MSSVTQATIAAVVAGQPTVTATTGDFTDLDAVSYVDPIMEYKQTFQDEEKETHPEIKSEDLIEHNGRRYYAHKTNKYILPDDELEQDRLDKQHQIFLKCTKGRLYLAPLANPLQVLDIATGTGRWALEFAQQHPSANILGTDLSLPSLKNPPPNLTFTICDAEKPWPFTQKFDYIHGRFLVSCFTDARSVIARAYDVLLPGGHLEYQDGSLPYASPDNSLSGSVLEAWQTEFMEATAKLGRPWTNTQRYGEMFEEVGFVDVRVERFVMPAAGMGAEWDGRGVEVEGGAEFVRSYAAESRVNLMNGFEAASLAALGRGKGWSEEKIKEFFKDVKSEMLGTGVNAYMPGYVVYGRKPRAEESLSMTSVTDGSE